MMQRIKNWQRFYRNIQRTHCVSFYTPPKSGNTLTEIEISELPIDIRVIIEANKKNQTQNSQMSQMPLDMRDAVKLELCWRSLDDQAKKWYLKYEYIIRMQPSALWRKLRHYGVVVRCHKDHDTFDRLAVNYLERELGK